MSTPSNRPAINSQGSDSPGQAYTVIFHAPVLSINRNAANPTNSASVSWTVTFAQAAYGAVTGELRVQRAGIIGASLSPPVGSGSTCTVTAATGVDGTLELDLVNGDNLFPLPGNLHF